MAEGGCFLEGKWEGEGHVLLNFMPPVLYKETSEFKVLRKEPVMIVNLQQYTKNAESGKPMHAENGFLKIFPAGADGSVKVEAMYSHPFSLNEFEFGTLTATEAETGKPKLVLEATEDHHFQRPNVVTNEDAKAKMVTGLKREYFLDQDGALNYNLYLAVAGQPLKHHLVCKMKKVDGN